MPYMFMKLMHTNTYAAAGRLWLCQILAKWAYARGYREKFLPPDPSIHVYRVTEILTDGKLP
jgi:hypothetical protein